ncbi:hypothetical protein [Nocardia cyriacigeorgica]|uniref:hypothetical protein n=1 Tax=Nocardia cyriacigeorgica TaxID=135487 RepID=UPI001895D973|nr:hypothetical protein [Nocardia cyriacigeorgica]MBF6452908.1 hypothetical protein [Nocardia cyriacigeorgica]MBF6481786.1 hypothetical protein [Nocardia cyriacigeorgica]MBF6550077.1 hypothetical protein [Nocardia cyriacigeorgica]
MAATERDTDIDSILGIGIMCVFFGLIAGLVALVVSTVGSSGVDAERQPPPVPVPAPPAAAKPPPPPCYPFQPAC